MPASRPERRASPASLTVALVWALIIYLTVPLNIFSPPTAAGNFMAANSASRLIKLGLLAIAGVLVLSRIASFKKVGKRLNVFFIVFLVLVPVSALWSISRSDTVARFASLLSVVAVCAAFCSSQWHPRKFQDSVRPVITLLLIGSVVFVMVNPTLAVQHDTGLLQHGAWHGLTSQKNPFGALASFGFIFWLHAWLTGKSHPAKAVLGAGLAFFCLVMSRSSTSLIATFFVGLFLLMVLRSPPGLRRYMPYLISIFAIIVVTYALAVLNLLPGSSLLLSPITAFTGKDLTFSERTEIWAIIEQHIRLSPLLGSGYGAYWIGPVPTSPSYIFLSRMYFYPTESHNGYLEIINDLGYVGMICLIGYLTVYIRQALELLRSDRGQGALFLAIFFQQAILNLSESCWLHLDSGFIFGIVTLATFALARALAEQKRVTAAAAATGVARGARRM
jgi:exopolysaccharide production protein ExoQ